MTSLTVAIYGGLLRLYPGCFRRSFAAEMRTVFGDALADARARGLPAVLTLLARELIDLPGSVARQHLNPRPNTIGGNHMAETTCPSCRFVSPASARYCLRCGHSYITRRERVIGWLDRHPWALRLALAATLIVVAYGATHTVTEAGLYFRGSYVLWLLAIGAGGLSLGWIWAREGSRVRRGLRGLLVLVAVGLAIWAVRGLDSAVVTQLVDDGWSNAFVLPGIALQASRFDTVADAQAYLGVGQSDGPAAIAPGEGISRVSSAIHSTGDGYTATLLRAGLPVGSVDHLYLLAIMGLMLMAGVLGFRMAQNPRDRRSAA